MANWNEEAARLLMEQIRKLRAAGVSGAEIGRMLGVTRATISYWENGMRSPAASPDLVRYLEKLGMGENMSGSTEIMPLNCLQVRKHTAMKRLPVYDINAPSRNREEVQPMTYVDVPEDYFLGEADFVVCLRDYYVMQQQIPEGSFVGIRRIDKNKFIKSGHIYLMWWEHEGLVVRYVYLDQATQQVVCRAHNDSPEDFPPQRFSVEQAREFTIGKVVWQLAKI